MKKIIFICMFLFITTNAQALPIQASALFNVCGQTDLERLCTFYVIGLIEGVNLHAGITKTNLKPFCEIKKDGGYIALNVPLVIRSYAAKHPETLLGQAKDLVHLALKEFTCSDLTTPENIYVDESGNAIVGK